MGAVFLNILSAVFNIFSFTLLIPILQILFEMDSKVYEFMPWDSTGSLKDIAVNNFYYYVSHMIEVNGPSMTLLFLGLFLAFMTLLKTACYFASSGSHDSFAYRSSSGYSYYGLLKGDVITFGHFFQKNGNEILSLMYEW